MRLLDIPAAATDRLLRLLRGELPGHPLDIDPGVPDIQESLLGKASHLGPVTARAVPGRLPAGLVLEAVVPGRDGEAGGQPLDVPVERARERLVEVVDIEDQAAVRGRE